MRLILILAFSLSAAGVAHAQLRPITPPVNPYALPPLPGAPKAGQVDAFKPYKPPAYLNPALPSSAADPYPHMRHTPGVLRTPSATPSDPYPNLRRARRPKAVDTF